MAGYDEPTCNPAKRTVPPHPPVPVLQKIFSVEIEPPGTYTKSGGGGGENIKAKLKKKKKGGHI